MICPSIVPYDTHCGCWITQRFLRWIIVFLASQHRNNAALASVDTTRPFFYFFIFFLYNIIMYSLFMVQELACSASYGIKKTLNPTTARFTSSWKKSNTLNP